MLVVVGCGIYLCPWEHRVIAMMGIGVLYSPRADRSLNGEVGDATRTAVGSWVNSSEGGGSRKMMRVL